MSPTSRSPYLSALVHTRDRAALLKRVLESLCHQTLARDAFEIVVVDDGSQDATREVTEAFLKRVPLRYAYQRQAGVAAARNLGAFMARGEILLFLDDDAVADPRLLEAHAEAHRRHPQPGIGILGHTGLDAELASDPLMHFVTKVGGFLFAEPPADVNRWLDFAWFWGGRSSCKRAMLLDHGVFDPMFRSGGEDVELAFRLQRHGFTVIHEPRAVTSLVLRYSFDDFCRRMERQGRSNWLFARLHPEETAQRWADVAGAAEAWRRLGPVYDLLRRSGRELDRVVRTRLEEGLGLDGRDAELLYRGYYAAFHASRIKGSVERAKESDPEPARSAVA